MRYRLIFLAFLLLTIRAHPTLASTPLTAADTGACTTAGACLVVPVNSNAATIGFAIGANASGNTIQLEGCIDSCTTAANWTAVNAYPTNSTTAVTSSTSANVNYRAAVSGLTRVRMRMSTLVSGTTYVSIAVSNGAVGANIGGGGGGSGTVTSVTFTGDGIVDSSTPSSAVTTSGTVTATALTQTANTVLAGPTTGSAANPTFRALVDADIPFAAPGAIGGTTPGTGAFTTLTSTLGVSVGASPPSACGGTGTGCFTAAEASTVGTPTAGIDYLRADSAKHSFLASLNGGSELPIALMSGSFTTGHCIQISGTLNLLVDAGAACGSGGSGDTITSPNSTLNVGGTSSATTLDLAGSAGEIMAGATPALTYTPALGKSGTAGTLAMFPASGNFTTTWGSAATASNTILGFATVPTTTDLITCVVSSTTCTLTDSGIAVASNKIAISAVGTSGLSGTSPVTISAAGAIGCATCVVASSPGAGIARFAGSTQTATSAELSGDATTSGSNAVTVVKINGTSLSGLASGILYNTTSTGVPSIATQAQFTAAMNSQYKTITCEGGLGDGLNAITAGTYLQSTCYNGTGATVTITGVKCYIDGGSSSTLNGSGNTLGALLTGAVTCSTSFAAGTQSANVALTSGDYIKFTFVADGTAKQTDWVVTGTY